MQEMTQTGGNLIFVLSEPMCCCCCCCFVFDDDDYISSDLCYWQTPEFDWTPGTIGLIDSSFFWGYLVTQIPGGYLASKYPANRYRSMALFSKVPWGSIFLIGILGQ